MSQLHNAEQTPIILWDDTVKRAWLLPAVSVLLFFTICQFKLLSLNFDRPFSYMTSLSTPGAAAKECLNKTRDCEWCKVHLQWQLI